MMETAHLTTTNRKPIRTPAKQSLRYIKNYVDFIEMSVSFDKCQKDDMLLIKFIRE